MMMNKVSTKCERNSDKCLLTNRYGDWMTIFSSLTEWCGNSTKFSLNEENPELTRMVSVGWTDSVWCRFPISFSKKSNIVTLRLLRATLVTCRQTCKLNCSVHTYMRASCRRKFNYKVKMHYNVKWNLTNWKFIVHTKCILSLNTIEPWINMCCKLYMMLKNKHLCHRAMSKLTLFTLHLWKR